MDFETMYRAMDSRDRRFDGRFFVAVRSTGIYCRPICPAPTPKRRNTEFYRYAAVAEHAGFRPCRRCRPEVSPDTAEWDTRADLVGRGLRLLAEGVGDDGVATVAQRLGVSERHLQRIFKEEIGATPGAVARSRRARLARQLLTETAMPITKVAFAAGFASVRTFNETIQQIYKLTPTDLRRGGPALNGTLELTLQYRPPLAIPELYAFLSERAIPTVEEVSPELYRRTIQFGDRGAVIELRPTSQAIELTIESDETDQLAPVIQRARQLLDLDADPHTIDLHLAQSPTLKPLIAKRPGLRLPGSYDPFETLIHTIIERGTSPTRAAEICGRIAEDHGTPLASCSGSLTRLFPTPQQLAGAALEHGGLSPRRATTVRRAAAEVVAGRLIIDGSIDPADSVRQLLAIPGIGAHTADTIAHRVLRDPDAFPARNTGMSSAPPTIGQNDVDEWRPWRGYAAMHLQASCG